MKYVYNTSVPFLKLKLVDLLSFYGQEQTICVLLKKASQSNFQVI